jgi:hypothetical protein
VSCFSGGIRSGAQPQNRPADFLGHPDLFSLPQVSLHYGLDRRGRTHVPLTEKVVAEYGLPEIAMYASVFKSLKSDFLQAVPPHAIRSVTGAAVQSPNPRYSAVNDASEFGAELQRPAFQQTLLRSFRGKPGGVSIRFLWRFEPSHFAKVGSDGKLWLGRPGRGSGRRAGRRPRAFFRSGNVRFATEVAGEGDFLHPAMNASLFKSLEGGGLGVGEAAFDAAFGKNPKSAAGLNQQKFDAAFVHAITNGGDLLPFF